MEIMSTTNIKILNVYLAMKGLIFWMGSDSKFDSHYPKGMHRKFGACIQSVTIMSLSHLSMRKNKGGRQSSRKKCV